MLSLVVSSLGLEAIALGSLLYSNQTSREKQLKEEEDILSRYESVPKKNSVQPLPQNDQPLPEVNDPMAGEWEYKIVRANRDIFRNPAIFHKLCQEEAEVGWVMLEKLDDHRVRFKRSMSQRDQKSSELPRFDPYRTHYGSSFSLTSWLAAIAFLSAIVLPAYFGYALVSTTLNRLTNSFPDIPLLTPLLELEEEPTEEIVPNEENETIEDSVEDSVEN